jgi:hypothetical protein
VFADFDNDEWPDLFFTAGHFFNEVDRVKTTTQRFRNPRLLYWNLGNGQFEDVADRAGPGISAHHSSRAAAWGDYDNDGNVDLLVMNMGEPPSLLHNQNKSGNNWLKVKLVGTKSNRSAIGAKVRITSGGKPQTTVVLSQSGYYSVNDSRAHFGLGRNAAAEMLEVVWPSGITGTWRDIKANQTFVATEGKP